MIVLQRQSKDSIPFKPQLFMFPKYKGRIIGQSLYVSRTVDFVAVNWGMNYTTYYI